MPAPVRQAAPSDDLREVYELRAELEYATPPPTPDLRLERKYQRLLELVAGTLPAPSLLDAGCGDGRYLAGIAQLADAPERLAGVDVSERILATAEQTLARVGASAVLVRANLESLPLPDGSFERVLCAQAIEHLRAPELGVAELARVLAPGGLPGPLDRQRAQLPDEGAQPPPLCRRPCAAAERKAPPGRLPARVLHAGGGQRARQRLRAHGRAARDVPHAPAGAARQADRDEVPERSRSQVATAPVGRHRRGRRAQARVAFEP